MHGEEDQILVWLSAGKHLLAVFQGMYMNASIDLAPNFRIRCRRNEKISTGAAVGRSKLETLFMHAFAPFRKKGSGLNLSILYAA